MRWIQAYGNKERAHFALKILFDPQALLGIAFAVRYDFDSAMRQCWQYGVVIEAILPVDQCM